MFRSIASVTAAARARGAAVRQHFKKSANKQFMPLPSVVVPVSRDISTAAVLTKGSPKITIDDHPGPKRTSTSSTAPSFDKVHDFSKAEKHKPTLRGRVKTFFTKPVKTSHLEQHRGAVFPASTKTTHAKAAAQAIGTVSSAALKPAKYYGTVPRWPSEWTSDPPENYLTTDGYDSFLYDQMAMFSQTPFPRISPFPQ
ncbi:hypothetical protein VTJ04DRAFT_1241 [Mycothermus thermophilus]|uniref:uncharacterized protein n=1 Tax=Humicola insolens TaxID=85995 RepID=UPI003744ACD5